MTTSSNPIASARTCAAKGRSGLRAAANPSAPPIIVNATEAPRYGTQAAACNDAAGVTTTTASATSAIQRIDTDIRWPYPRGGRCISPAGCANALASGSPRFTRYVGIEAAASDATSRMLVDAGPKVLDSSSTADVKTPRFASARHCGTQLSSVVGVTITTLARRLKRASS